MTESTLFAPAKINLALHITGRRDNGFHDLSSIMAFTDIGDEITIANDSNLSAHTLNIHGEFADHFTQEHAVFSGNLIGKAVDAMERHSASPVQDKWSIHLNKTLPIASGVGGGSADAAAVMRFLAERYHIDLSHDSVYQDILRIGSELPICLQSCSHRVEGIGEQLSPLQNLPHYHILLINPLKEVSTPRIFEMFREEGQFAPSLPTSPAQQDFSTWDKYLEGTQNNLTPMARALCPEIKAILDALQAVPDCCLARMSGSGATCFGLFHSANDAEAAEQQIRATLPPHYWIKRGQLI